MTEKRPCKVVSTYLGFEDHGLVLVQVDVDFGTSRQSFQASYSPHVRHNEAKNLFDAITGIFRAFNVDRWEKLPGRSAFALIEDDHIAGFEGFLFDGGAVYKRNV